MAAPTRQQVLREQCEPPRELPHDDCGSFVPDDPPERPDPAIYSQRELLAAGSTPTWDSPDILTVSFFPAQVLDPFEVTVRNESPDTAAVGAVVELSTAPFGLGMERTPVSSQVVDIPAGAEVTLDYPVPEGLGEDGLLGAFVDIDHPHDAVAINSAGAQVTSPVRVEPGTTETFSFPVRNAGAVGRDFDLDVYADGVSASVSPSSRSFGPDEQISADLTVDAPDPIGDPPGEVTVVARADGRLVDGLTYLVFEEGD